MTEFVEVRIADLFVPTNGKAKYIRDYMDRAVGEHPVYSASLTKPFGHVDTYDYEGHYLTWVMNGYGGRVQEIHGRFSANRDRGVFVPRDDVLTPDLTYLRFAIEPQLVASAVGRRVDGRLNEYTKIYPDTAGQAVIRLPVDDTGSYDYARMKEIGDKLRRVESAQVGVGHALEPLRRASFALDVSEPTLTLSVSQSEYFSLSIGNRVLKKDFSSDGIPVYSANPITPFGAVKTSNLDDFDAASVLWGIDNTNFDYGFVPAETAFATTDHCGRLQVLVENVDPEYVYVYLQSTRSRYGFARVFRSSLRNMRSEVEVVVPIDDSGNPSLERQRKIVRDFRDREAAQLATITALEDVLKARMTVEM